MLKIGGELYFLEESLGTDDRGELGMENLDCDLAMMSRVFREKYCRHSTATELTLDAISIAQRPCEALSRSCHRAVSCAANPLEERTGQ